MQQSRCPQKYSTGAILMVRQNVDYTIMTQKSLPRDATHGVDQQHTLEAVSVPPALQGDSPKFVVHGMQRRHVSNVLRHSPRLVGAPSEREEIGEIYGI